VYKWAAEFLTWWRAQASRRSGRLGVSDLEIRLTNIGTRVRNAENVELEAGSFDAIIVVMR
jgi:hypothetical protein